MHDLVMLGLSPPRVARARTGRVDRVWQTRLHRRRLPRSRGMRTVGRSVGATAGRAARSTAWRRPSQEPWRPARPARAAAWPSHGSIGSGAPRRPCSGIASAVVRVGAPRLAAALGGGLPASNARGGVGEALDRSRVFAHQSSTDVVGDREVDRPRPRSRRSRPPRGARAIDRRRPPRRTGRAPRSGAPRGRGRPAPGGQSALHGLRRAPVQAAEREPRAGLSTRRVSRSARHRVGHQHVAPAAQDAVDARGLEVDPTRRRSA